MQIRFIKKIIALVNVKLWAQRSSGLYDHHGKKSKFIQLGMLKNSSFSQKNFKYIYLNQKYIPIPHEQSQNGHPSQVS